VPLSLAYQNDLPGVVDETPHPDALEPEVSLVVEGAGISEAPGVPEANFRPNEIPDLEMTRVLPDRKQQFPAYDPGKPFAGNPRGFQHEGRPVLGDPRVFANDSVEDNLALFRPVRDVIRYGVVIQDRADPVDSKRKETEPDQAERRGMPAGDAGKQGENQAAGEESQDPRTVNFDGVPEDDTADEEKKKNGKGTLDHTLASPWAAGLVRDSLIAHSQ